jgi:hypothetical protein
LVQRELISHQILLPMELAPALPTILGDRVQLQQVIINLTMNGIEAMQSVTDRPRELMIRSRQDEKQQVLVSVTDCGVGISAENVDRLFNAFCRTVVRSAVYPLADHFHQIPQAAGRPAACRSISCGTITMSICCCSGRRCRPLSAPHPI